MKPKISLITLGVTNLQKSLEFYRDGLKLPVKNANEDEDIVFFDMEGTLLSLYPLEKLAADAKIDVKGSGFKGVTLAHNVASEEKVNEVFKEALEAGAKSVKKPEKVFWGGYSGYFSDPDGYLWEVAYNPFMDLT